MLSKRITYFFTLFLFCIQGTNATNYPYRFTNTVYDDYIKTISIEVNNLPTNFPVMTLNGSESLLLKFDDLLNEERILYYRIVHCNWDWTPSNLKEYDYITGFNDERLRSYEYSVSTKVPFIHYWQEFPNRDTKFNVSGNYLVVIYEESIDYPILTRRFIITENQATITAKSTLVADVENFRFNQDFQFDVSLDKIIYRDPQNELTLLVLQNENWDAYRAKKPNFLSRDVARFTTAGAFSYKGLAEYREFDTRGLQYLRRGVQRIERQKNKTDVLLTHAYSRWNVPYLFTFDFNGKFFVANFDALLISTSSREINNLISSRPNLIFSERDSIINYARSGNSQYGFDEKNINSDYLNVIFTLDNIDFLESGDEIFVLGAMNDWEPRAEFRMKPSENGKYLTTEAMLKQGYYNYYYGILKNDGSIDYQSLEGSWNETENEYQAIAYFRGFGDIYDRVIGIQTFNTNTLNSLR
ncbi:MAG: type IX secretion system plug protein domain-containing protein [Saprospiraceae bacterium]